MILYSLRSRPASEILSSGIPGNRITKFDDDLDAISSYIVCSTACECPQWTGRGRICRHMAMLPKMLERIDTPWFFEYETGMWHDPTGQASEPTGMEGVREITEEELIEGLKERGYLTDSAEGALTIAYERTLGPEDNVAEEFAKLLHPCAEGDLANSGPKPHLDKALDHLLGPLDAGEGPPQPTAEGPSQTTGPASSGLRGGPANWRRL